MFVLLSTVPSIGAVAGASNQGTIEDVGIGVPGVLVVLAAVATSRAGRGTMVRPLRVV